MQKLLGFLLLAAAHLNAGFFQLCLVFGADLGRLFRVNLANLLCQTKKYTEAVEQCQEALRIEPNNADAHCYMGAALAGLGQWEQAAWHFRRTLEISPRHAKAQAGLADAARLGGQSRTTTASSQVSR